MTAQIEKREVGSLILENIPEIPNTLSQRLNHYQNTREAFLMDWMKQPNGLLLSTRFGEAAQLHIVRQPAGARHQITFFNEPIASARACPDPEKNGFLFMKDAGGDEIHQLYYFDMEAGKYELLTDGHSKHGFGLWNNSGTAIIYNSTKRNQVDHDLYIYDFGSKKETLLLDEGGYWVPIDWSEEGRYVSAIHYRSVNESALYIIDTLSGSKQSIIDKENVACRGGYWMPDGKSLYFASDEFSECRTLMCYDLESNIYRAITIKEDCELEMMSLSADGKTLAAVFNEEGYSSLYLFDTQRQQHRKVEILPKGVISNLRWKPDSSEIAFSLNRPNAPADVYVLNIGTQANVRWTYSEVGGLNPAHFIEPSLIHYPTFDQENGAQRNIPAYYYRPTGIDTPCPVLIYIHGGPESQYRPAFSPAFQYYLKELNIAVVAPNVRGSTGYGKSYLRLDDGYKREDSVKDIGQLLDWVDSRPELDSERVAVMGGSYGGYMVLASMAHYNNRLSCGIDVVGISNFVTFLKNTKSYRRSLRRVEYGDERDPKMRKHLERISPTANAHKITKPMLIVQGLNDPRVPASEAEQMLKAIRSNGGEAWYLLAKDEGHGFRKKGNRDFYNKAVILFLQQHLLVRKAVAAMQAK
jgi:dipeptidyl aminopeptidase/acylaminoacyl peptidase